MKHKQIKIIENSHIIVGQKYFYEIRDNVIAEIILISKIDNGDTRVLMLWMFTPERGWQKLYNDVLSEEYKMPHHIIDKWPAFKELFDTKIQFRF